MPDEVPPPEFSSLVSGVGSDTGAAGTVAGGAGASVAGTGDGE
ncbi:hypothetical protein HMPREF1129_2847 [Actinomyces naeslundii str. Howell 279]|uniref:Uncharacterized protein n=1 Tax=Actinomyces naeslundii (strain ATCC 12104 / DSM 43013 / CCUG 2238 / JCM 8349 / NCTC 10301 / Howell 279) TaxID=1115803 RepID=J3JL70_ACTNH|nr:hypothetical protein HMPREF1129_2847 [Actinomyces naeslundii str. Howell 279]